MYVIADDPDGSKERFLSFRSSKHSQVGKKKSIRETVEVATAPRIWILSFEHEVRLQPHHMGILT